MPVLNHDGTRPTADTILVSQILDLTRGVECNCGRAKRAFRPFCAKCYWSLPSAIRFTLYRKFGEGQEAYREALRFLEANKTD